MVKYNILAQVIANCLAGKTRYTCTRNSKLFTWQKYDIRAHVLANCLKGKTNTCTCNN